MRVAIALILATSWIICAGQGLEPVPQDEYLKLKSPPILSGSGDLPDSYVIDTKKFPEPRSQGTQPSCTAWAVGYYLCSYYHAEKRGWTIATDDQIYSPAYLYQNTRGCGNCRCGTRIDRALNYVTFTGNVPISLFPYDPSSCGKPPEELETIARQNKISDWYRLAYLENFNDYKQKLYSDIPIVISAKVGPDFKHFANKTERDIYTWNNVDGSFTDHAMLVVGYDDTRNAFKLLNSWGTAWGVNGYAWVSYESFKRMISEAYVVATDQSEPINNRESIPNASGVDFSPYVFREPIKNNRYYFTVGLDVNPEFEDLIEKVVYYFNDSTFTNKASESNKPPSFTTSYEGATCVTDVDAIIHYTNGTAQLLNFNTCDLIGLNFNNIETRNATQISAVVTAKPIRSNRFNFVIELRGIEAISKEIKEVEYLYDHPTFVNKRRVTSNLKNGFKGGYVGWGCLRNLQITIRFKDGTTKTMSVDMCKQIGW